MSSKVETVEKNKLKLTITVSAADFEVAMQKAYLKVRKSITIPGFRKGKAPRKVIETHYGEGVFYNDAFDDAFPAAYDAAVKEHDLEPVDRPELGDVETIGEGQDLVFTVMITVKPEVELGKYKGLSVEAPEYPVTDEDVDAEVAKAQEKVARWVDVEREVKTGDRVIIDYSGSVDDEKFAGGTAEKKPLEIGSNSFIPGFEDQVIGMKVGEEKDIQVKFPEEYHAENLKGKDAVFAVKLHEIKEKEMPELDDEFAKDVSEFDTLDEYKADIKAKLEESAKTRAENELENNLVMAATENTEIDIPECMVDRQVDYMLQEMQYRMSYQGIRLEDYLRMTGSSIDDMKAQYKDEAKTRVKTQLVLEAIQKAENVEASEEDIEAELAKIAERGKKTVDEIKKTFKDSDYDYLKDTVVAQKTVAILKDGAKLKKPKKKAAKKAE